MNTDNSGLNEDLTLKVCHHSLKKTKKMTVRRDVNLD